MNGEMAASANACFDRHLRQAALPRLTARMIDKLRSQGFLIQRGGAKPHRTRCDFCKSERRDIVADRRSGLSAKEVASKWNTTTWAVNDIMARDARKFEQPTQASTLRRLKRSPAHGAKMPACDASARMDDSTPPQTTTAGTGVGSGSGTLSR